jgi:L-ascorbate metabolism protein UlaG (beta-lactamase superfamily)
MKKSIYFTLSFLLLFLFSHANDFEKDVFKTSKGDLTITFVGHGTLMMEFDGKVVHIDPVSFFADYKTLPKADLILVTHAHGDHLDAKTINLLKKETTEVVLARVCADKYEGTATMNNGDSETYSGLKIEAVPAYNIKHMRSDGNPFHPKGEGNGYIIHFGDKKVYVAGDSENIPEMNHLENIDIAFLPMNLPYTMTPEMVADAAKSFKPKVMYPYHYGETDTSTLLELMKNQKDTEVRIRKLN